MEGEEGGASYNQLLKTNFFFPRKLWKPPEATGSHRKPLGNQRKPLEIGENTTKIPRNVKKTTGNQLVISFSIGSWLSESWLLAFPRGGGMNKWKGREGKEASKVSHVTSLGQPSNTK